MQINRFNEFRFARRFRVANRVLQIILGLFLIVSLNFLAAKYFSRIDLTQSGTYTLAQSRRPTFVSWMNWSRSSSPSPTILMSKNCSKSTSI